VRVSSEHYEREVYMEKEITRTSEALSSYLKVAECINGSLQSFISDPPDTNYQAGYRDALEELLRVTASLGGVPYESEQPLATVLERLRETSWSTE
jgi:hypothetical protein